MNILKLSPEKSEEILEEVLPVLRQGGVVAIPTDTIYGFAADALNLEAVRRIFKIKGRPEEKTLPIFVSSIEEAEKLVEINACQRKFLEKVWPGKVTCVLKAKDVLPPEVLAKDGTVALRIPKYDFVSRLLKAFGGPLTGTSANLSGNTPLRKIKEIIAECATSDVAQPDIIVDAGDLPNSEPSTVVDLTITPLKILRPGAVLEEELQKMIDML